MASLPTVAIIGRPNTGKSTLFNRMVGRKKAIVSDAPGTTRDHIAHRIEGERVDFLLVDTGGMGGGTDDMDLEDDVHRQSLLALENADVIVLTMTSQEEPTSADLEIVDILRKKKRKHVPVIIAVTMCDNPRLIDELLPQYYQLGIADAVVGISAPHKIGIDDLEDTIERHLVDLHFVKTNVTRNDDLPSIAVIGKPNVGKSSIVNAFMSESQRDKSPLLVSDIAGTTRDTTDTVISYHDKEYLFMDTAGIKRRKQTKTDIEVHAYFRSIRAVEMCDITVLVLDAQEPVAKQEKRIAGLAVEEGKGLVIVLNKADLLDKDELKQRKAYIKHELPFCTFAPVLPCSAHTREGLLKLFDIIETVHRNRIRTIPTKTLNQWYRDTVHDQPMRALSKGKYITQAKGVPPTFVVFVNNPKRVQVSQLRFLDNRLRESFDFEGTPVRWITKGERDAD